MVLLSCSGAGGGIYAKLANGVAQYNCARFPSPTVHRRYDLLHVVNKRIIANAFIEARFVTKSRHGTSFPEAIQNEISLNSGAVSGGVFLSWRAM